MLYEDEFGVVWAVDIDGSLIQADVPKWPQSDDEFLAACGIESYEEVNDGEL